MTLTLVWLRSIGDVEELVFASDSRLRSPYAWDACPKILPLSRGDAALSFAGDTSFAYPVMLQVAAAVSQHARTKSRALDLTDFKGHVLEIINGMREYMHSFPVPAVPTGEESTLLVLGGYSWKESRFKVWTLHYDGSIRGFTFRPATQWLGVDGARLLAVAGDHVKETKAELAELLRLRGKLDRGGFDMEPFEILCDVIRSGVDPSIGGPPQLLKVYRHMNATPFSIYWPDKASGKSTVFGRTLLPYERPPGGVIDPDTLDIEPSAV